MALTTLKELNRLEQFQRRRNLKTIDQRIAHIGATQGNIAKGLGHLGLLFNMPANAVYNAVAKSQGSPTVPLTSSHVGVSDIIERFNPKLVGNQEWQKWRLPMDIVTSIGLDPTTYLTFGATRLGAVQKLAKGFKVISKPDNVTGKIKYFRLIDDIVNGKNVSKEIPLNKNTDLFKKIAESGFAEKELPRLSNTLAERVRDGSSGMKFFRQPILSKQIASLLEGSKNIASKLIPKDSKIGRAFRSNFIKPENALNSISEGLGDAVKIAGDLKAEENRLIARSGVVSKTLRDLTEKVRIRQASKLGQRIDDYVKSLNLEPNEIWTSTERRDFINIMQFGMPDDGIFRGDIIELDKNLNLIKTTIEFDSIKNLNQFKQDWEKVIPEVLKSSLKPGTEKIRIASDTIGRNFVLREHYLPGLSTTFEGKEIINDKFFKSRFFLPVDKIIKGKKRTYRDLSLVQTSAFRTSILNIMAKNSFSNAEKAVARILVDGQLGRGNHTVSQIMDFFNKNKNTFDDQISEAIKAGDQVTADFLQGVRVFAEDINKVKTSLGKEEFKKVLDVPLGDILDRAKDETIRDFYNMSVPLLEFFGNIEVAKRLKHIKLYEKLFIEGFQDGIADIGKVDETIKGFVQVSNMPMTAINPNVARNIIGDKFESGKSYRWFLREDVHDVLKQTQIFEMALRSEKINSLKEPIVKALDWYRRFWSEITLFPFPAFHIRNLVDNMIRTGVDGVRPRHNLAAFQLLTRKGEFSIFKKFVDLEKKFEIDTPIGKLNADETWDVMNKEGVLSDVAAQLGEEFRPEVLRWQDALKAEGVVGSDKLAMLNKIGGRITKLGRGIRDKYRRGMGALMKLSTHADNQSRVATMLRYMEDFDPKEAARLTKLTMIDYLDLTPFERRYAKRIFAFYGFKKGIIKWLSYKYATNPLQIKAFGRVPDVVERIAMEPDEEINKAYYKDWLNDASAQIGFDSKGNPIIFNFRGWSSLAEVINFIKPVETLKESVFPHYKMWAELMVNQDFHLKYPIEQYEGQKKLIFGVAVKKRGVIASLYKTLRLPKTLEQITESALKGQPKSIFGTPDKPSWLGYGSTLSNSRKPDDRWLMLAKIFAGVPLTVLDVDRAKRSKQWELIDLERSYTKALTRVAKQAGKDPKFLRSEQERLRKFFIKQIDTHKKGLIHLVNPKKFFTEIEANKRNVKVQQGERFK